MPVGPVSGTGVGGGSGLRIVEEFSATTLPARAPRGTHTSRPTPPNWPNSTRTQTCSFASDETTGNTSVWNSGGAGLGLSGRTSRKGRRGDIGPRGETFPSGASADEVLLTDGVAPELGQGQRRAARYRRDRAAVARQCQRRADRHVEHNTNSWSAEDIPEDAIVVNAPLTRNGRERLPSGHFRSYVERAGLDACFRQGQARRLG